MTSPTTVRGTTDPAAPRRRALVLRGGWEGHAPVATTELFLGFLEESGFEVEVTDDVDVYLDEAALAATDLIVQNVSQLAVTPLHIERLGAAIADGTGFAGWHGGIIDSFRNEIEYQRIVGAQFLFHPAEWVEYELRPVASRAGHPILEGFTGATVTTELYWSMTDPGNDVLADYVYPAVAEGPEATPWTADVTMPAAYTRSFGAGRVFVSVIGHSTTELSNPAIRGLIERGMLWAAR